MSSSTTSPSNCKGNSCGQSSTGPYGAHLRAPALSPSRPARRPQPPARRRLARPQCRGGTVPFLFLRWYVHTRQRIAPLRAGIFSSTYRLQILPFVFPLHFRWVAQTEHCGFDWKDPSLFCICVFLGSLLPIVGKLDYVLAVTKILGSRCFVELSAISLLLY